MARSATVATGGQHPAVVPAVARRAGHPGAARRRTRPVHLRPRRPHARGRRHQLEPTNAGPKDNRELERRSDVLTYTSEPLRSALEITGPVTAELFVSSSRPHTDFFAHLCDVDQKGRSVNITDGLIRLTSASPQTQQIRIDL
jgi:putative CocE/NonD family hydrolase